MVERERERVERPHQHYSSHPLASNSAMGIVRKVTAGVLASFSESERTRDTCG